MAVRHGQVPAEPGDARHRLLEAASLEFAERGYAGATVREIVARAGTNLNAVNYHFGSKQQLYVEVIRYQTALSEAAHPQRPAPGADTDPQGALRAAVLRLVSFMLDPSSLLPRLYALELVNPSPAFQQAAGDGSSYQRPLADAVRALLGPAATPRLLARCVRTVYSQCAYFMFVRKVLPLVDPGFRPDARTIEDIADHVTEFAIGGIERLAAQREPHARPAVRRRAGS